MHSELEKIEFVGITQRYSGVTFHAMEENVESSTYLHSGRA